MYKTNFVKLNYVAVSNLGLHYLLSFHSDSILIFIFLNIYIQ